MSALAKKVWTPPVFQLSFTMITDYYTMKTMKMTTTKEISRRSRERITIVILLMMPMLVNYWYGFAPMCWILEKADVPTKPKSEIETEMTTQSNSGIPKIIHLIWLTPRNSYSSFSNNSSTSIPEDGPLPDDVVHSIK